MSRGTDRTRIRSHAVSRGTTKARFVNGSTQAPGKRLTGSTFRNTLPGCFGALCSCVHPTTITRRSTVLDADHWIGNCRPFNVIIRAIQYTNTATANFTT